MRRLLAAALLAVSPLALAPAAAQAPAPPSPEEFLGYPLGAHFTPYASVQAYARALAAASTSVVYRPYGLTPERRELFQLVIARPDRLRSLGEILARNAELTRPGTPESRARQIAAANPAVVYLSYGVHGNEASSSEAAMWTAWELARGAPAVDGVLDSLVVVIDPVVNPDGRDRYVEWYRSVVGATPNPDPQAREHREPWPGGRYNHYLFDLNRDWAWRTQPETLARLASWESWNPEVHVDFHEMGYNSSYFFFPATAPINPIYPAYVLDWARRFGQANARAFDAHGWAYFTGDSFDLFYPGYGDSWPSLLGAIGMTYEQAGHGAAGLAVRREAGDTLTLRDRALHHWASGEATLRTAAAGRSRLLLDFAAGQRAVGVGQPDVLLVPGPDTLRLRALVEQLQGEGIEVERAGRPFRADATAYPGFDARSDFPAGTYLVRARQPRGRLATTLLQPRTRLLAEFSYDISAWSLPYAYGVEAQQIRGAPAGGWESAEVAGEPARVPASIAGYGYLVRPGEEAAAGVVAFLRQGGRVRVLSRPSVLAGRRWPAGSWFLPALGNDSVQRHVTDAGLGALATPVASGLAQEGIDLGSEYAWPVRLPRVGVVSGEGISPTSFGAHWFFLEQRLGLPFDALLTGDLAHLDLSRYDVLVVPDAAERAFDDGARDALRAWVRDGGRLVAVADGARALAPLFDVKLRAAPRPDSLRRERFLLGRPEREREEWLEEVPGVILPARADSTNPLAWGAVGGATGDRLYVLHQGDLAFEPAAGLESVAFFPEGVQATSGVISDASLEHLQQGLWLADKRVGRGSVVLFADDPLFRLFWRATQSLYINALLVGPRE